MNSFVFSVSRLLGRMLGSPFMWTCIRGRFSVYVDLSGVGSPFMWTCQGSVLLSCGLVSGVGSPFMWTCQGSVLLLCGLVRGGFSFHMDLLGVSSRFMCIRSQNNSR